MFDEPGCCDLTANVDFALLQEAVKDVGMFIPTYNTRTNYSIMSHFRIFQAGTYGTLDQSTFLTRMGIAVRLETLLRRAANAARRSDIQTGVGRLIDKTGQGMGRVYRVLGILGSPNRQEEVWPFIPLEEKVAPQRRLGGDLDLDRGR